MRRQGRGFGWAGRMVVLAVAVCLFPCACADPPKPFVYESDRELKPGPGLFSGEDGVFTIYGKSEDPKPSASAEDGGAEDPGSSASSGRKP